MGVYDDLERHTFASAPVRLYYFMQQGRVWFYCNSDENFDWGGHTFTAIPISDDGIKQKTEVVSDDFTITVPSNIPVVQLFRGTPPSDMIRVELRIAQLDNRNEAPLMWRGFITSVRYKDGVSSEIVCNTQIPTLNRRGLRLSYTRGCPHVLYDEQCGVDFENWGEWGAITGMDGNAIYFGLNVDLGRRDGRFTNGYIAWHSSETTIERRPIQYHSGGALIMASNTDSMYVGQIIKIYPGCNRTPADCHNFNNIANYGGFPFMPGKSPFDGEPVF